jgi:hypothetical protein
MCFQPAEEETEVVTMVLLAFNGVMTEVPVWGAPENGHSNLTAFIHKLPFK